MIRGNDDERFMAQALAEAEAAIEHGDVPVGAVIVYEATIIGRGHNQRELLADPTAHAEMIALTAAAQHLRRWRLDDCTMFVTLEPCAMCAGAIVLARMGRLVFGADDPKAGACGSVYSLHDDVRMNHRVPATTGVLADASATLLRRFFAQRRR